MPLVTGSVPVLFKGCFWSGHDRPCNTLKLLRRLTLTKEICLACFSAYVVANELPSELSGKAQN